MEARELSQQLIAQIVKEPTSREANRLFEFYRPLVVKHLYYIVHDHGTAEDLAQGAILKAFSQLKYFKFQSQFKTWLFRIAKNHTIDFIRKEHGNRRMLDVIKHQEEFKICSPMEVIEYRYLEDRIQSALHRVDHNCKELLMMFAIEDLSYQQIAETTGNPIGTVKSRIARARKQIEECIKDIPDAVAA